MKRLLLILPLAFAFAACGGDAGQAGDATQSSTPPNVAQGTDGLGALLPPGGARPQPEKLKLPPGFRVSVWAENVEGARTMTLAPDGTVFVGTWPVGKVYALPDRDHDNHADEVITIASGMNVPNGVEFRDGTLFVAELNRIVRFDNVLAAVKPGMAPLTPTVIFDELPSDPFHGWKYLRFGPDGYLYFPVGVRCNICESPEPYGSNTQRPTTHPAHAAHAWRNANELKRITAAPLARSLQSSAGFIMPRAGAEPISHRPRNMLATCGHVGRSGEVVLAFSLFSLYQPAGSAFSAAVILGNVSRREYCGFQPRSWRARLISSA
jgi:glucose/arabinose dehydrogenase